jgi:TRAP-type C4-dicarboxylate transport system substrate-binding protein
MKNARRSVIFAFLAAMAVMVAGAARAETIELKLSHYLPPNHTFHKYLEAWAADVAQRSGGRLSIKIYPANQLGPVQRQFDLARSGQADLAVGLSGATPGRYPMTELAGLPFVAPKAGNSSEVTSTRLTELAPKYLADEYQGVHILLIGVAPPVKVFTARRDIAAVADFQGLKLRFQSEQHAKVLRLLGAVPLQVPPGEVADGMSKGVIDGALFNCEAAESFGLGPIAHHVIGPSFLITPLALVMNAARYESLPPDLRAIIDDTTGPKAAAALGRAWDAAEEHGRAYMAANNTTLTDLPPDQVAVMRSTLQPLVKESIEAVEKSGKPAQAFIDAFQQ